MKRRTLALAGTFASLAGSLVAVAILVVAFAEAVNGVCCCWQSEREGN